MTSASWNTGGESFPAGGALRADPDASLREKILRQHNELQILFDISSAVHSSPHLEDVLHQSLMAILRTLRFKMGAIYLLRSDEQGVRVMSLAAQQGFSSALVSSIRSFPVKESWLSDSGRKAPVVWLPLDRLFFPELRARMADEGIQEIVRIALFTQNGILGLLYVANHGELQIRPDRKEFLTTIGQQIGVAIENAQLFESVQRAKTELEISFDAIQHSIFLVDASGRILRVNKTTETVYGEKNLLGSSYWQVLYSTAEPPSGCPIRECMWSKRPVQKEGPHPRWGGFYRFYAFPVLNLASRLERIVYYEKDETEARRLEQRLQQTERLKSLGTLAAGIAHEIRNPLATINFNAQMLQRELNLDASQGQMLGDLLQEVRKIDTIVREVLSFARPREPQFLSGNLNDIVRHCHNLSKVHMRKAKVDFHMELQEDLPDLVMDSDQISQVVMNLVINAVEAMPQGGTLTVRTLFARDLPAVVLSVEDTGEGILPEDEGRIFDPFFTRKADGTGLGLSICRRILERHGAHMEVESTRGQGSTFRVVFALDKGSWEEVPGGTRLN
ncbi:GAF sensor signal transduction histidine kinase [Desulfacinum hydrothermale DSM 13146]|uniref:histidine kinase n=1 Tax=Desulfacinum hydrothermale DSM 13146 TaxID=1121390 RepID=A0A1W1XUP4_9BACT|nr:sensor histidine kinase [Desulfacinum hydrothermale]SMC27238.1 GAF sensor signal transduction histidine kinase [Desulfacinum hydrothermale DSM 13146]